MAEKRRVEYGIQQSFLYPIENGVYGTGIEQKGAISFTKETESENTSIFADNRIHVIVPGTELTTGEITYVQLDELTLTSVLGYKKNAGGVLTDTGVVKPFGFAFVGKRYDEDGNNDLVLFIQYRVQPKRPNLEKVTAEDAVEAENLVIAYDGNRTSLALDDDGNEASFGQYVCPPGTTEAEVQALLEAGIPLPGDTPFPPADTTPPVITVTTTPISATTAENGVKTYADVATDAGITAIDDIDGDITANILYDTVNPSTAFPDLSTVGTVTVTLDVSDAAGNPAIQKTVDITVT